MKRVNVAVAIIVKGDKILLTQRYSPDNSLTHLKWQLPGGGIERNESIEEACIREALEETGLVVEILKKSPRINVNVYDGVEYAIHGFKCKIISGKINIELDKETNAAQWYKLSEIKDLECLEDTYKLIESTLK